MWRADLSRVSRTGSTHLQRDRHFSERFVVWDRVMSAALNVTKYVEPTDVLPEPAGNSLRDYLSGWFSAGSVIW